MFTPCVFEDHVKQMHVIVHSQK